MSDDCIFFFGRFGYSDRWRPANSTEFILLQEPRWVLQLDNFISLERLNTPDQADNIIALANRYGVDFRWLAVDRSGVGHGVYDVLKSKGKDILGIAWGAAATNKRILDEHSNTAHELYDGVSSEMGFAFHDWLEAGQVKASPNIDMSKLQTEILGRKIKPSGRLGSSGLPLQRLEEKRDFKSRVGYSPDRFDSLIMTLHICRMNAEERARLSPKRRVIPPSKQTGDDQPPFLDFSTG